jgi:hypothetical protein
MANGRELDLTSKLVERATESTESSRVLLLGGLSLWWMESGRQVHRTNVAPDWREWLEDGGDEEAAQNDIQCHSWAQQLYESTATVQQCLSQKTLTPFADDSGRSWPPPAHLLKILCFLSQLCIVIAIFSVLMIRNTCKAASCCSNQGWRNQCVGMCWYISAGKQGRMYNQLQQQRV